MRSLSQTLEETPLPTFFFCCLCPAFWHGMSDRCPASTPGASLCTGRQSFHSSHCHKSLKSRISSHSRHLQAQTAIQPTFCNSRKSFNSLHGVCESFIRFKVNSNVICVSQKVSFCLAKLPNVLISSYFKHSFCVCSLHRS